jgi:hypothetical protein
MVPGIVIAVPRSLLVKLKSYLHHNIKPLMLRIEKE